MGHASKGQMEKTEADNGNVSSIAVSLSRSVAKSSANRRFFSYKGSLPDRDT